MRISSIGLFAAILLGGLLVWLGRVEDPQALIGKPAPRSGALVPAFTLTDLDGEQHVLSEYHGRPIIINFWATWCPPCREEMPDLQAIHEQYADQGLVILAVNNAENPDTVRAFVEAYGITFPVLMDDQLAVTRQYEVRAFPSTFFVDRAGRIKVDAYGGPLTESYIESQVQELID